MYRLLSPWIVACEFLDVRQKRRQQWPFGNVGIRVVVKRRIQPVKGSIARTATSYIRFFWLS